MKFRLNKVVEPIERFFEGVGYLNEQFEKVPVVGGLLKFLLIIAILSVVFLVVLLVLGGLALFALLLQELASGGGPTRI